MELLKWFGLILLLTTVKYSCTTELTFELPDSARECFHQEIMKNTSTTLEFQVNFIHNALQQYNFIS